MKLTVIIPTYNRPACIERNLAALAAQMPAPDQIIIVDASPGDETAVIVERFTNVLYFKNPAGRGNIPTSRNMALEHTRGDIVAFLDDDAFPRAGWAAALLETYRDTSIAGVAGRALNDVPGEESIGLDSIGTFTAGGKPIGNFAADPGKVIDVQHQIGCNMSFRASLLARLGGFRDDLPTGPFGICEETELCVRARRLGYRFVFNPAAVADHIGAKQVGGRRFSPKYSYYHARNNLVMVIRNFGPGLTCFRNLADVGGFFIRDAARKIAGAAAHLVYGLVGLIVGLVLGLYWLARAGFSAERGGTRAEPIRSQLAPPARDGSEPSHLLVEASA